MSLTLGQSRNISKIAALVLGKILTWRLAGFARRARRPSYAGVYVGPLLATGLALVGLGDAAGLGIVLGIPLAIPFGALVGALLGAER